ncbi:MAG: hypothetical protein A2033_15135 [Bacteroidetes bacterium GWA2_31_9]|nr:MAG: hypothetical protein A2033_15135 [Bacteroidetes bacterium GWA2_31_9]
MKTLAICLFVFLYFTLFNINKVQSQTCKDFIGISVNVKPSTMVFFGYTTEDEFKNQFSNQLLAPLNNEFSSINVEFYTNYYFLPNENDDAQGPINTINVIISGYSSNISDVGLQPFVKSNLNAGIDSRTFVHEFGHVFGLAHPFPYPSLSYELVTRPFQEGQRLFCSDCDYKGDGFCETSAQAYGGGSDINGDSYNIPDCNFMNFNGGCDDYTNSYFTAQQKDRMRNELETNGYTYGFVDYGHTSQRLKADFTFNKDNNNCDPLSTITFNNTSTFKTGTWISATVFEWDFGDGTIVTSSDYNTVNHTYSNFGTYKVKLICTWYHNGFEEYFCNFREQEVVIKPILSAPYLNEFESEININDFCFGPTFKKRIYYGFNNYSALIHKNSFSLCIDATSTMSQILSFDINHINYIYDYFSNNESLNLYINDQLITAYTLSYADCWSTKYIDLSSYSGQIVNIKLATINGTFLIDNLKIENATSSPVVTINKNLNCNGQATAVPSGGYPPYTFVWSDPFSQTNETAINLTAGNYTVTITDSHSNTASASVSISGIVFNAPTVSITSSNVTCSWDNDGSASAVVSGGTPPYSYHWSNNYPLPDIINLNEGTYIVTVTDNNSCINTATAVIIKPEPITINVTTTNSCENICNGTITANPNGGTPPYSYQWQDGQTTQAAIGLCGYSSNTNLVTITDLNGCYNSTQAIYIGRYSSPHVTITNTNASCYGYNNGSIQLTINNSTAPYTYQWNSGQTTEDISSLSVGSYTVTITDINSCPIVTSAIITQPHQIELNPIVNNITCYGASEGSINLNVLGSETFTFLWSNGETTEAIESLPSGTYTVTITNSQQCSLTQRLL